MIDWVSQDRRKPFLDTRQFDFFAQRPGGSLSIGSNTVTLSPVPLGVNGTNTNHYIWISGGSGIAEACLITGGSALSGHATGTITFSCSFNHSGAWTVTSATAGFQESIYFSIGESLPAALVIPRGFSVVHAPTTVSVSTLVSLLGLGIDVTVIARSSEMTAGNIIQSVGTTGSVCGLSMENLTIYNAGYPTLAPMTSGAGLAITDQNALTQTITNIKIEDGYDGIVLAGSGRVNITNYEFFNRAAWAAYPCNSALTVQNTVSNQAGGNVVENIHTLMDQDDGVTGLHYGIRILASDGLQITDPDIKARIGMSFENSASGITNVKVDGAIIDRVREIGVQFTGNNSIAFANIRFNNYHIVGYSGNSAHLTHGVLFVGPCNVSNVIFNNGIVAGFATDGFGFVTGGVKAITVSNSQIFANGVGMQWSSGDGGTIVIGNKIYDAGGGVQQYGLSFPTANSQMTVIGNDLRGNLSTSIQGSTNLTDSIVVDNPGFNPVGVSAISVGASPFTYTAGPTREIVYISGTVTSVKRGTTVISTAAQTTVELYPFTPVTVTYPSGAPTMIKDAQ